MTYTPAQAEYLKELNKKLTSAGSKVEKTEKAYNEAKDTYESLLSELGSSVTKIKLGTFTAPEPDTAPPFEDGE